LLGKHSTSLSSLCPVHTHGPFFIHSVAGAHSRRSCCFFFTVAGTHSRPSLSICSSCQLFAVCSPVGRRTVFFLLCRRLFTGRSSDCCLSFVISSNARDTLNGPVVVVACSQTGSSSSSFVNALLCRRCRCPLLLLLTRSSLQPDRSSSCGTRCNRAGLVDNRCSGVVSLDPRCSRIGPSCIARSSSQPDRSSLFFLVGTKPIDSSSCGTRAAVPILQLASILSTPIASLSPC